MINRSTDGKQRVLSLSYGKDSLACLGAIEQLGLPLDRIVHAEVWATDTIPADLPPMVDFKAKADAIIKERWGFEVEHICAMRSQAVNVERERERESRASSARRTYENTFYSSHFYKSDSKVTKPDKNGIYGFPCQQGAWCNSRLKVGVLSTYKTNLQRNILQRDSCFGEDIRLPDAQRRLVYRAKNKPLHKPLSRGADKNSVIQYLGIAADEPIRIERHTKEGIELPLVQIGWEEAYCRKWCEENDLLSPIYTTSARGGCWFCHNQSVGQLRILRHNYPDLWQLLLKWDSDSPVSFKADGHTVHDFDRRFALEDECLLDPLAPFRWSMLDEELNYNLFLQEEHHEKTD